jgi:5-methylcytosine-specific restriction endonuclease McrA
MTDAKPYPKASQLARGERRYRRKVASPKQWQAIIAAKGAHCRICQYLERPSGYGVEYHHLVSRKQGGDDVGDNIVPLCMAAHYQVTRREPWHLEQLARSLTDAEYAYVIGKLGEGGMERLFGVGRS